MTCWAPAERVADGADAVADTGADERRSDVARAELAETEAVGVDVVGRERAALRDERVQDGVEAG